MEDYHDFEVKDQGQTTLDKKRYRSTMILRSKDKFKLLWTSKDRGLSWFWGQRSRSNYSGQQKIEIENHYNFEVKGQGQTTL